MGLPVSHVIRPRDMRFPSDTQGVRWWMGGDPVATAYYNVFSASFPLAERYFIDAVRRYRDRAAPELQGQIAGFIAQESLHSREHAAFNRDALCSGYDLAEIDFLLKKRFDWARTLSPVTQVASTAAFEHFTTSLACEAISNPRHLETAPPQIRRLWCWHAGEEIEHKSVAFDTFMLATRDLSPFRRWRLRCSVMLAATWLLFDYMLRGLGDLFRQDGIASVATWMRFAKFAFVSPGVMRRVLIPYLAWYRPGFHPWQRDDHLLVRDAERLLGIAAGPETAPPGAAA